MKLIQDRLAVYTAIYGGTDILIDPPIIPANCDFFCFTDRDDVDSSIFKVIKTPRLFPNDTNRSAKFFKVFPHKVLPDYEYSFWIDARTYIKDENIFKKTVNLLKDNNLAIFKHPERTSIYDEAKTCIDWGKDKAEIINPQIEKYKKDGYLDQVRLIAGTFIFRRHHSRDVIKFEEGWWKEILKHSKRDQISFPYIAWKTKLKFNVIEKDTNNNNLVGVLRYRERDTLKTIKISNKKNGNNIVIYSALFGDIDNYIEHNKIPGCDIVLFTDNKELKLKNTKKILIDPNGFDSRKLARMFKTLPHKFFPNYEYSIWIDASIEITNDALVDLTYNSIQTKDLACFKHMHRDTLYDEVNSCLERKKDNPFILTTQYRDYKADKFIDNGTLIESGVLIRKHMNPALITFSENWWKEIKKYSIRDQISFPYVLFKNPIKIKQLRGFIWENPYFRVREHNETSSKYASIKVKQNILKNFKEYFKWYKLYRSLH